VTEPPPETEPTDASPASELTIHQVASLVRDLDATIERLQRSHGWGPWEVYEYVPGRLRDLRVYDEPADFTWLGAEAQIGPEMYVELLQPTSPGGILQDWMAKHGEGVHHVGYWAPSIEVAERELDRFKRAGTPVLLSAWIDEMFFYYLDTSPMIYEVWGGDLETLAPIRRVEMPSDTP
jgi:catechol 2,3-dioxygenase-like lactoylglutathione lyase family enzyme